MRDMKKNLAASLLLVTAMTLSCQKHDSAAEQQLAQRKVELDTREEALAERKSALDEREKALDERQKALDEREKALAQKGKAAVNAATNPAGTQVQIPDQTPDPAQAQAVREMIVRQLSAKIPERSQVLAEKGEQERVNREQHAQSQPRLDGLQSQTQGAAHSSALSPPGQSQSYQEETQRALERQRQAMGTSGGAVFPAPAATSPPPSPAVEATSASPSQTPE
jgi:hypothetical protein